MSQIGLPLDWPDDPAADAFLVTPSNARAVHLLDHWGAWPVMAAILPPDDPLVRALLARRFLQRGLDARPDLIDWLATRIERRHAVVERVVDLRDRDVTERQRRLSIPLARATLGDAGLIAPGSASEKR